MTKTIHYITRKRLPSYNSIEELFLAISARVKNTYATQWVALRYTGASPIDLLKNIWSVKADPANIYHITGDVHYMAFAYRKRAILTVHDVDSAITGSFIKRMYVRLFWFWLPALFVKKITVISEFTKQQLTAIIPSFAHKITVVYNPVNPKIQPHIKDFNVIPTILLLGTKSNKNLERSLQAIKDIPCKVVIVGELSATQTRLLTSLKISYTHKQNISFDAIVTCYKQADIVCFPSLYEGFGMPIIEAQATGRVVLSSNIGAMKEIAGKGAHLVDPYSVAAIREGILKIMKDPLYRERLIANGFANASKYSLDNTVSSYMRLYNEF
ncbi:glycosyltransferase family 4 protein [Flavobacteriaceae bacterium]|nr:glycosyltransferase family 4 protein [Flavobacteriaceae bacterium]